MKPLIVYKTNVFPSVSETFVLSNIVETIKSGYEVQIIAGRQQQDLENSQSALLRKHKLLDNLHNYTGVKGKSKRYFRASLLLLNPLLLYYFIKYCKLKGKRNLEYLFQLAFYLPFKNAQAFHIHFGTAVDEVLYNLKCIGYIESKVIVTFHGFDAFYFPEGVKGKRRLVLFDKLVTSITVNSNYLKEILIKKGFDERIIEVVPLGIDTSFFTPTLDKKPDRKVFKLISVGRLVPLKGHSLGIKTVKWLVERGYTISYTIIGDGEEKKALQTMIDGYDLQKIVTLKGGCSQDEIKEALDAHDCFLMTSTVDADGRREAFGLVSLEAQAMGVPVLAFDSGGVGDTIIDTTTGFLVPESDEIALGHAIIKLIENPSIYLKMKMDARANALNKFRLEETNKKFIALYH